MNIILFKLFVAKTKKYTQHQNVHITNLRAGSAVGDGDGGGAVAALMFLFSNDFACMTTSDTRYNQFVIFDRPIELLPIEYFGQMDAIPLPPSVSHSLSHSLSLLMHIRISIDDRVIAMRIVLSLCCI